MINTKQNISLDPFSASDGTQSNNPELPDSSVIPGVASSGQRDELVESNIAEYLEMAIKEFPYQYNIQHFERTHYICDLDEKYILDPMQIEMIFNRISKFEPTRYMDENYPSGFMTVLIHNSFRYGRYNNFRLETGEKDYHFFADVLKGRADEMLNITIDGNIGGWAAGRAEYLNMTIKGRAFIEFGVNAKHSTFNVHGHPGSKCGYNAEHCIFNLYEPNYDITHGIRPGLIAKDCEFNVVDKELYGALQRWLMPENTLRLIDCNNNVLDEIVFTEENKKVSRG